MTSRRAFYGLIGVVSVALAGCAANRLELQSQKAKRNLSDAIEQSKVVSIKEWYNCGAIIVAEVIQLDADRYCRQDIAYFDFLYEEWRSREDLAPLCWHNAGVTDVLPFDVRQNGFDYRAWSNESSCAAPMGSSRRDPIE